MQGPTLEIEKNVSAKGYNYIAGVDEAGRGPLAGPVVVASVILGENWNDDHELNDSKKLNPQKRDRLYDIITNEALAFKIVSISPKEIDRINILQATLLGMRRSLKEIKPLPDYAIVDGNCYPKTTIKGKAIINGDSLSKSISAASILAKVTRDRIMIDAAKIFPEWSFEKHKGYPTNLHRELISKYGLSPLQRKSFKFKKFNMKFLKGE